jgi:hypothetical protein
MMAGNKETIKIGDDNYLLSDSPRAISNLYESFLDCDESLTNFGAAIQQMQQQQHGNSYPEEFHDRPMVASLPLNAKQTSALITNQNYGSLQSMANISTSSTNNNQYNIYNNNSNPISTAGTIGHTTGLGYGCPSTNSNNNINNYNSGCGLLNNNTYLTPVYTREEVHSKKTTLDNKKPTSNSNNAVLKNAKQSVVVDEPIDFEQENNNWVIDSETLNFLVLREGVYGADPFVFERRQPNLTWMMRAILLDWMMEVSQEFTLKRETFHLSINYVDRFLSAIPNLNKMELQLVGVAALYVASKVEVS